MRYFLAVIYTIVCTINGIAFFPLDNFRSYGTFLFLAPLPSMALIFAALSKLDAVFETEERRAFITFMVVHYVLTVLTAIGTQVMWERSLSLTVKMFDQFTASFVFGIAWYLAGQLAIWASFFVIFRTKVT